MSTAPACILHALEPRCLLSAGALDTTFGASGHVFKDFGSANEQPLGVQIQTDGKVLVSGTWGLARYTRAGALDSTFGNGGVVSAAGLSRFVIQPDGKILVATTSGISRYTAAGALDNTFAGDGTLAVAGGTFDLGLLTDGRIVAMGANTTVRRFNSNGTVDGSFAGGSAGVSLAGDQIDRVRMVVQSNGKVIVGGVAWTNNGVDNDFTLSRLNANGTVDTTYGTNGKVLLKFDSNSDNTEWDRFGDLAIAPDNRVIISAVSPDFSYVYRFSTRGINDLVYQNEGNEDANGLTVQPDGKILIVGGTHVPGIKWAVRRLTRAGALDSTFGSGGTAASVVGNSDHPYYVSVVSGDIVTAGVHFRTIAAPGGGTTTTQDLALVDMTSGSIGTSPFGGLGSPVPGLIQAENFDLNGSLDKDAANLGGQYRYTATDIQQTTDTGGGYNVGWIKAGEWLQYTVSVKSTAKYKIEFRVSSPTGGGRFYITIDGKKITPSVFIPPTGGDQTWMTVPLNNIALTKGKHTLRLVFDRNGASGFVGNLNWIRLNA